MINQEGIHQRNEFELYNRIKTLIGTIEWKKKRVS